MIKGIQRDLLVIISLGFVYCFFLLTTQTVANLNIYDAGWYANRANLLSRGIITWGEPFVYTIGYPLSVGIVDRFVDDLVSASLIVNTISLIAIFVGIYLLGYWHYNRFIALLAVSFLALNPYLHLVAREIQFSMLFMGTVTWSLVLFSLLLRSAKFWIAFIFSLMLALAMYTRFEGSMFAILIPIIGYVTYQRTGHLAKSFQLMVATSLLFGVGVLFYFYVLAQAAGVGGSGTQFSFFEPFLSVPSDWQQLSRRTRDMLHAILHPWWIGLWLLVIGLHLWLDDKFQQTNRFWLGIIGFYTFIIWILATWPFPSRAMFTMQFFALLFGWAIWRLWTINRLTRLGAVVIAGIWSVLGLASLFNYAATPPFTFQEDTVAQDAVSMDEWLTSEALQNTQIYTLCGAPLPYSDSNFYYIWRLNVLDDLGDADLVTSPRNLLPEMFEQNALFMLCGERIFWSDWLDFLNNPQNYDYSISEIHRINDKYIFYEVVPRED